MPLERTTLATEVVAYKVGQRNLEQCVLNSTKSVAFLSQTDVSRLCSEGFEK